MILHIIDENIFTLRLIDDIEINNLESKHLFLVLTKNWLDPKLVRKNIVILKSPFLNKICKNLYVLFKSSFLADKIVMHGPVLIHFYFLFPIFNKKLYWVLYGFEIDTLQYKNLYSFILRRVLKRVKYHCTHIKEDSDLVNNLLNSDARHIYALVYSSNVSNTAEFRSIYKKERINVLVGNSTSPTNNHLQAFCIIEKHANHVNHIYCPLSYGIYSDYKANVVKEGFNMFGDKFIPITDFMSYEKYFLFLQNIDIALFNHSRQEGMGALLSLLSLGKLVYMNPQSNAYKSFKRRGFIIENIHSLKENEINFSLNVSSNKLLLESYYSHNKFLEFYRDVL